jgi:arsenite methyltransferase
LKHRRGAYGVDAPYVPLLLGSAGLAQLAIGLFGARNGWFGWILVALIGGGAVQLLSTASYLYTTRLGKFVVWADLLGSFGWRGDERVLDLGCGRGAVLLMAAQLLPQGRAVGVDLWNASDQSGNRLEVTQHNAEIEGVDERVELHTGDMRALPFPDGSFDVVLSSLALHNIPTRVGRTEAIDEGVRVLKPGGRVVLVDFRSTHEYLERVRQLGLRKVEHRWLGWRLWYGGPWTASKVVTGVKPG